MHLPNKYATRQEEITQHFKQEIDKHIDDIVNGNTDRMFHIKDIAAIMCIHPVHLSTVISTHTGNTACHYFEHKILDVAKQLLARSSMSIVEIANLLTYDASNFTKFFKTFEGITPSAYRKTLVGVNT